MAFLLHFIVKIYLSLLIKEYGISILIVYLLCNLLFKNFFNIYIFIIFIIIIIIIIIIMNNNG